MKGIEWDCKGLESIAEEAIKEKSDLSLKAIQDKKKYSALMQLQIKCCKNLLLLKNIDYHNVYQTTYLFLNKCLFCIAKCIYSISSKYSQKPHYQIFDLRSQIYSYNFSYLVLS